MAYEVWYQSYSDLVATDLEEATQIAKDYRPEVKLQTRDDLQSQLQAREKGKSTKAGAPSERLRMSVLESATQCT